MRIFACDCRPAQQGKSHRDLDPPGFIILKLSIYLFNVINVIDVIPIVPITSITSITSV